MPQVRSSSTRPRVESCGLGNLLTSINVVDVMGTGQEKLYVCCSLNCTAGTSNSSNF